MLQTLNPVVDSSGAGSWGSSKWEWKRNQLAGAPWAYDDRAHVPAGRGRHETWTELRHECRQVKDSDDSKGSCLLGVLSCVHSSPEPGTCVCSYKCEALKRSAHQQPVINSASGVPGCWDGLKAPAWRNLSWESLCGHAAWLNSLV